jgi:prepilin-type processing-associated H-X9-DG protein
MASKIKTDQVETLDGTGNITLNNSVTMAANQTLPAPSLTGALPAISAANLTAIPAANITGTLPAISGANLTGLSTFDPDGAVTINESSADVDFRVESNGNANMLFVDGGTNRVGIGEGSPDTTLHITGSGATLRLEAGVDNVADNSSIEFTETGTTGLRMRYKGDEGSTGALQIMNIGDSSKIATFLRGGGTDLYYNNSKKFETTSAGGTLTGTWNVGKVLQIQYVNLTTEWTVNSTSEVDLSGLTATITPASTSSKIICMLQSGVGNNNAGSFMTLRLYRASTQIAHRVTERNSTYQYQMADINYVDSPSTTSATTYKITAQRSASGSSYLGINSTTTSLILMEIA